MGVGSLNMRPAVFLDRDGVLNRATVIDGMPHSPASLSEVEIMPDAQAACTSLRDARFLLIVVTNQPDVARGNQQRHVVEAINEKVRTEVPIDDIYVCYHDDRDDCACRKPKPGLLLEAALKWQIELGASYMIGDRWKDIDAGLRAGCRTVFIDQGYKERKPPYADFWACSLGEASRLVLEAKCPSGRSADE